MEKHDARSNLQSVNIPESAKTTGKAYQAIAHIIQEKGFATGIDIRESYIRNGCAPTTSSNFTLESSRNFKHVTSMKAVLMYDE